MAAESQFHVLAVDDSLVDRKLVERLLKTFSYQVTTVDSGSKALEFLGFREHEDEEAEELSSSDSPSVSPNNHQESSSLRTIPVVIMSSENVPSRISRCLEGGADEFFLKPLKLSDVNRLRPHMTRTKLMHHKQKEENREEYGEETDDKPEIQPQNQPGMSSYKRKAMEEGLSPDRTRPRYNGVTTVII
ncbi:hypothetical protein SAY87_012511 [Trapa incisa]|uniref:Response regulatory domain-containing protein n=1 Tax=Trapa incisa TaxID=236973 RepID=A0AAN7JIY4_9MYRT|nr:hypothetical protein SAY87_012511 [Trapa incisa]